MAEIEEIFHMPLIEIPPVRTIVYSSDDGNGLEKRMSRLPFNPDYVDYSSSPKAIMKALDSGEYQLFLADFSRFNSDGIRLVNYALRKGIKTFRVAHSESTQIPASVWKATESGVFTFDSESTDAFTAPMSRLLDIRPCMKWVGYVQSELHRVCQEISDIPTAIVLINGPKGSGKYTLAQVAHSRSKRCNHRFVYANCHSHSVTHIKWNQKEKETFAATIEAMFRQANKGTLYFHEIEKLDYEAQETLYEVIKKNIVPHAPTGEPNFTCHIVISARQNLQTLVSKGDFSRNLYRMITANVINIPTINNFREDLGRLASELLDIICVLDDVDKKQISKEALTKISETEWLGNIRELYDAIIHAIDVTHGHRRITSEHLRIPTKEYWSESFSDKDKNMKKEIIDALRKTKGNKGKASKLLKISRKTLYLRMERLDIPLDYYKSITSSQE